MKSPVLENENKANTPPQYGGINDYALSDKSSFYWYRLAWYLALATIGYNVVEGLFCTFLGYRDGSFTLFGFGLDSFIECISGIGIAHLTWRLRGGNQIDQRDNFERLALRITGAAFYALAVGLVIMAVWGVWAGQKPTTTFWGIVVALFSIAVMWAMIHQKEKAGRALQSEAILADAQCARVCMWMSVILLFSSGLYGLTGFGYLDALGAFGLGIFSFREGKECFEKAANNAFCACDCEQD